MLVMEEEFARTRHEHRASTIMRISYEYIICRVSYENANYSCEQNAPNTTQETRYFIQTVQNKDEHDEIAA